MTEILGRLSVCLPDRETWKQFLTHEICNNYCSIFGHMIYDVYLNLGLDPPECLPKDGSDFTNTTSTDRSGDSDVVPIEVNKSPMPSTSPRRLRSSLRQSLPRALFIDSAVAAVAESLSNSTNQTRRTDVAPTGTPISSFGPSTAVGSDGSHVRSLTTSTPIPAPQLVLIPSTTRSRRKGRTPVKHIPMARTSRKNKSNRTPPGEKHPQSAPTKRAPSHRKSRPSAVEPLAKSAKVGAHRTPHSASKHRTDSSQPVTNDHTPQKQSSKHGRYHRSVRETPNPERSYPRWERARLAAAEKTKNKVIIVEESPIKPVESLGSPLRRLRRANSMLTNLYHLELQETSRISQPHVLSDPIHYSSSETGHLDSETPRMDGSSQSVTMSRAERWCRKQFEEELSLSQFTTPQVQNSMGNPQCSEILVSTGTSFFRPVTASGLLSVNCSTELRRHNSNLFANLQSPEPPVRPSTPVQPPVERIETPPANILRSDALAPVLTSPKTTPRRSRVAPRRTRHLSAGGIPSQNSVGRDSPQVFDEEAMFLGRDEFLNETNTPSSHGAFSDSNFMPVSDTRDSEVNYSDLFSYPRKRPRASPVPITSEPPLLRLTSLPRAGSSVDGYQPSSSSRRNNLGRLAAVPSQSTEIVVTPVKNRLFENVFPILAKPGRSPFAPLHVFNRQTEVDGTRFPGDLFESNTTVSSQSASHVFALRTRLFGNSDSNEHGSFSCDPPNSESAAVPTSVTSPCTADHSRHFWNESSPNLLLSSDMSRLRQHERRQQRQEDSFDSNSPIRSRRLKYSVLSASATAPNVRPRRSLFH